MDFVDFNLAKKLKEKGFDYECIAYYYGERADMSIASLLPKDRNRSDSLYRKTSAPTISQVLKWLREYKQIHVGIIFTGRDYTAWIQPLNDIDTQITIHDCDNNNEAAIAGIKYILDNNLI